MNFFQIISLFYGFLMVLKFPLVHKSKEKWAKFELEMAYTKEKPKWLWKIAAVGVVITAVTLYMQVTAPLPYSWIVTLLITLTQVKMAQLLFNYEKFREFVVHVTENWNLMVSLNIVTAVLGMAFIYLGLYVY